MRKTKYTANRCKASTAKLLFFIFILVNCVIWYYIYRNINSTAPVSVSSPSYRRLLDKYFALVGEEWKLNSDHDVISHKDNEWNCSSLEKIHNVKFLATGWTKAAYKVSIAGKYFTMKKINLDGHDLGKCVSEKNPPGDCFANAASKLLIEIVRLKKLSHPNIIEVIGYCIPRNLQYTKENDLALITEFGEPLDVIRLLQMSWESRIKIALGLTRLLHFLSSSSMGPISLNDFRRQQFVLVQGEIKLVDVDDIGTEEPHCIKSPCCYPNTDEAQFTSFCTACKEHVCVDYNAKLNVLNAAKHFIKHILPHSVPNELEQAVNLIVRAYENASWNTSHLLKTVENIANYSL